MYERSSSAPRKHLVCWKRRAAGLARPRPLCKDDLESHVLYEEFREPCSLRGTGGICTIKLLDGFAVHRACYGVVGFTMNGGTKGCEVVSNGKWLQRAKATAGQIDRRLNGRQLKCTE